MKALRKGWKLMEGWVLPGLLLVTCPWERRKGGRGGGRREEEEGRCLPHLISLGTGYIISSTRSGVPFSSPTLTKEQGSRDTVGRFAFMTELASQATKTCQFSKLEAR